MKSRQCINHGASVIEGGGIRNAGTLGVFSSEINGSQATRWGGGISNSGELTVTDSLIVDNMGGFGGGGIFNAATGTADVTSAFMAASVWAAPWRSQSSSSSLFTNRRERNPLSAPVQVTPGKEAARAW